MYHPAPCCSRVQYDAKNPDYPNIRDTEGAQGALDSVLMKLRDHCIPVLFDEMRDALCQRLPGDIKRKLILNGFSRLGASAPHWGPYQAIYLEVLKVKGALRSAGMFMPCGDKAIWVAEEDSLTASHGARRRLAARRRRLAETQAAAVWSNDGPGLPLALRADFRLGRTRVRFGLRALLLPLECVVCLDRPRATPLHLSHHYGVCEKCALELSSRARPICPVCRVWLAPFEEVMFDSYTPLPSSIPDTQDATPRGDYSELVERGGTAGGKANAAATSASISIAAAGAIAPLRRSPSSCGTAPR